MRSRAAHLPMQFFLCFKFKRLTFYPLLCTGSLVAVCGRLLPNFPGNQLLFLLLFKWAASGAMWLVCVTHSRAVWVVCVYGLLHTDNGNNQLVDWSLQLVTPEWLDWVYYTYRVYSIDTQAPTILASLSTLSLSKERLSLSLFLFLALSKRSGCISIWIMIWIISIIYFLIYF